MEKVKDKVKLPREVAGAIETLRAEGVYESLILWRSSREDAKNKGGSWGTLFEFAKWRDNMFKLADALRYGFEIEDEPITVTITPEQQDRIREFYKDQLSVQGVRANIIISTLNLLGITIPGVNGE